MDRPLINPTPQSFARLEDEPEAAVGQPDVPLPGQLAFPIGNETDVIIGSIRNQLLQRENVIKHMPLLKSFSASLAITTSFVFSTTFLIMTLRYYSVLPKNVLAFFNPVIGSWNASDRSVLLFLPVLFGIIQAVVIVVNSENYNHNRRLAELIYLVMSFINVIGLITVFQMLSLVTDNLG
jgi:hypothetical protein